jgi:hypothetical protein
VNEILDDDLRTMMRTAVANAPEAPTVAELIDPQIRYGASSTSGPIRPLSFVAAAIVVLALGALAFWPRSASDVRPVTTIDADVPANVWDGEYWAPIGLPDGWNLVDVNQHLTDEGWQGWGSAFVFERRSDAARILVRVPPPPDCTTDPCVPSTTRVPIDALRQGTWKSYEQIGRGSILYDAGDDMEFVAISSIPDEAATRALTDQITIAAAGGGFAASLPASESEWTLVDTYVVNATLPITWDADLELRAPDGRTVVVFYEPAGPIPPDGVLLDATISDPTASAGSSLSAASWTLIRDGIVFSLGADDLDDGTAAMLLSSMEPSTRDEWRRQLNRFASQLALQPTSRTIDFESIGVTISEHDSGTFVGTCARRGSAVGCHPSLLTAGSDEQLVILLDDGSWLVLGAVPAGSPACVPSPDWPDGGGEVGVVRSGDDDLVLVSAASDDLGLFCTVTDPDGGGQRVFVASQPAI